MTATVDASAYRVPAYRVPAFRRYAVGQAVSVLGDQVWYVALSWAAVQIAPPGVAGLVLAASSVPRLVLVLFGGVLVDRREPRQLMINSDIARALVALAAAGIALWQPGLILLVVVALVFGVADAVFLPAASALQPRLLDSGQYASGSATTAMANRAALMLGAPLGGVLVAAGGLPLACGVNAVTFVVSVLALRTVQPRRPTDIPQGTPARGGLVAGLRYIGGRRALRILMLVTLFGNLGFVGPMNVGLAFAAEAGGWGAGGVGVMLAGFGTGALVSGIAMMRFQPRRTVAVVIGACLAVQSVAVVVPVLTGSLLVAVLATTVAGLMSGPSGVLLTALMQTATNDAFRGPVGSVSTCSTSASPRSRWRRWEWQSTRSASYQRSPPAARSNLLRPCSASRPPCAPPASPLSIRHGPRTSPALGLPSSQTDIWERLSTMRVLETPAASPFAPSEISGRRS